jgi:L-alanine-DL-glutamate epimerase-like enolase superfamily enzyme
VRIAEVTLWRAKLPLVSPYKVSRWEFHDFEPFIAELRADDGRLGWGEAVITDGYGHETMAEGWRVLERQAERTAGLPFEDALSVLEETLPAAPQATSVLHAAVEMLAGEPLFEVTHEARVPLLAPVSAFAPEDVPEEIERLIGQGFRTLKVKVGFGAAQDLARVRAIQACLNGRAEIRLDANQAYGVEEGRRFAAALDPAGIQLFEQPCDMDDWEGNAAVAAVSTVPVMLDESIYGFDDIARAAGVKGVGLVKLKLKKLGGARRLEGALRRIRELGLTPVLGDGTATDIGCWQEACVARSTIDNAGENNGFLKLRTPLFRRPLRFDRGDLVLEPGRPELDHAALAEHAVETRRFSARRSGA